MSSYTALRPRKSNRAFARGLADPGRYATDAEALAHHLESTYSEREMEVARNYDCPPEDARAFIAYQADYAVDQDFAAFVQDHEAAYERAADESAMLATLAGQEGQASFADELANAVAANDAEPIEFGDAGDLEAMLPPAVDAIVWATAILDRFKAVASQEQVNYAALIARNAWQYENEVVRVAGATLAELERMTVAA